MSLSRLWPCTVEASRPCVYGCIGARSTSATGPSSTIRPAYMTAIRSAISDATPRSWVTKIVPMPSSRCNLRSRISTWICTVASSAVVGSSASSKRGPHDSAMAIIARWRSPPEIHADSWQGGVPPRGSSTSNNSNARARASDRLQPLCRTTVSAICVPDVGHRAAREVQDVGPVVRVGVGDDLHARALQARQCMGDGASTKFT